jgi:hypothetical protein
VVSTSTTFVSSTSTSSSTTTSSLPGTVSQWRFYVQIAGGPGHPSTSPCRAGRPMRRSRSRSPQRSSQTFR